MLISSHAGHYHKLQQEINSFGDPAPNIVICGDFNLPNSPWGDTTSSVPYEREMFDCINQLSNDNFLQQLVTQPTHRGGNTLDLVFTNNDHLIHSHECFKPPLASTSDHYIIECKSRIKGSAEGDGETKPEHVSPLDKLNFFSNDIDWESLGKSLDIDWSLLLRDHPPDRKLELITEKIYEVCNAHIPERKSLDRSGKPKIPRDRRILM